MTSQRMRSSKIALVIEYFSHAVRKRRKELIVWDWRTGESVSDILSRRGEWFWLNLGLGVPTLERQPKSR